MCRICGRMVKCFFESMPSRTPRPASTRSFSTSVRRTQSGLPHQDIQTTSYLRTPPSFVLPHRRKLHQVTTLQQEPTPAPQFQNTPPLIPPDALVSNQPFQIDSEDLSSSSPELDLELDTEQADLLPSPPQSTKSKPLVLSKSLQSLLPALHAQPPHYVTTHIHRFPYLLTTGDTLRLPFHLHGVSPGDILRFNRASLLGSRDYTLKAGSSLNSEYYDGKKTNEPNYLDERLYECRVRVLGVESQPMTIKEKTKRRNRRVQRVKSKHKYTVLKVMEVRIKGLEELREGGDVLLLE